MNDTKCKALKAELAAQSEPQIVSAERFFDGNDDLGSIGCNLMEHPGVDVFRDAFASLLRRQDVQAVYAQISELDPGEGSWPFADTVLVVGTIPAEELREAVSGLKPDEVSDAAEFGVSPSFASRHDSPILAVWWD
ncbi:MAG: hypothetical protein ABI599_00845 [Flavobacteriales bacterium]